LKEYPIAENDIRLARVAVAATGIYHTGQHSQTFIDVTIARPFITSTLFAGSRFAAEGRYRLAVVAIAPFTINQHDWVASKSAFASVSGLISHRALAQNRSVVVAHSFSTNSGRCHIAVVNLRSESLTQSSAFTVFAAMNVWDDSPACFATAIHFNLLISRNNSSRK
jgi:hypothetical protein